jgi:hypothetical protein
MHICTEPTAEELHERLTMLVAARSDAQRLIKEAEQKLAGIRAGLVSVEDEIRRKTVAFNKAMGWV